uniref:Uncharacterized protein n=1 Tax=Chromera velia CCMP2878 TaxID=1169474 RepID=A0A0G4H6L7_9ALVE|eukprot:Cvel_5748.t1-p1 / transcript=Cvel_5748.t1 / gene=Cvel_5748 / organism=Chromera_velia_CCMP2878 / gene_product=hypothetical protein / transcript_product=hypothetical protein / location=Cvel_scaffold273:1946-3547(-) / protein_length=534 / sequence_SO=supercontig / SO=protein_coding / is_pseudo=false
MQDPSQAAPQPPNAEGGKSEANVNRDNKAGFVFPCRSTVVSSVAQHPHAGVRMRSKSQILSTVTTAAKTDHSSEVYNVQKLRSQCNDPEDTGGAGRAQACLFGKSKEPRFPVPNWHLRGYEDNDATLLAREMALLVRERQKKKITEKMDAMRRGAKTSLGFRRDPPVVQRDQAVAEETEDRKPRYCCYPYNGYPSYWNKKESTASNETPDQESTQDSQPKQKIPSRVWRPSAGLNLLAGPPPVGRIATEQQRLGVSAVPQPVDIRSPYGGSMDIPDNPYLSKKWPKPHYSKDGFEPPRTPLTTLQRRYISTFGRPPPSDSEPKKPSRHPIRGQFEESPLGSQPFQAQTRLLQTSLQETDHRLLALRASLAEIRKRDRERREKNVQLAKGYGPRPFASTVGSGFTEARSSPPPGGANAWKRRVGGSSEGSCSTAAGSGGSGGTGRGERRHSDVPSWNWSPAGRTARIQKKQKKRPPQPDRLESGIFRSRCRLDFFPRSLEAVRAVGGGVQKGCEMPVHMKVWRDQVIRQGHIMRK